MVSWQDNLVGATGTSGGQIMRCFAWAEFLIIWIVMIAHAMLIRSSRLGYTEPAGADRGGLRRHSRPMFFAGPGLRTAHTPR